MRAQWALSFWGQQVSQSPLLATFYFHQKPKSVQIFSRVRLAARHSSGLVGEWAWETGKSKPGIQ